MATLNDITVGSDTWYSLTTLSGQPLGTAMELQIKTIFPVLVQEVSTKPADDDKNGRILFDLTTPAGYLDISGAEEIWLKCKVDGRKSIISVETV